MTGNTDLVGVDEGVGRASIVYELAHGLRGKDACVGDLHVRRAVVILIQRDDRKAAAGQLYHVLILMVEVVVAAVGYHDEGYLVFGSCILGDVNLCIHGLARSDDDIHVLDRHGVERRLEQGGKYRADKAKAQRDRKKDLRALFHWGFSFLFSKCRIAGEAALARRFG